MGNFINDEGKIMSEEELKQVTGGWTFAKGTGFFDQLIRKSCPKCGCVDFSIRSISEDGKTIYVTCKKCGHDCYMTE